LHVDVGLSKLTVAVEHNWTLLYRLVFSLILLKNTQIHKIGNRHTVWRVDQ